MIPYYVEVYLKFHPRHFWDWTEIFDVGPFEDENQFPSWDSSSPNNANEWMVAMKDE